MKKVKYPTDNRDRENLEKDFLTVFNGYDLQGQWRPLRGKLLSYSTLPNKNTVYHKDIEKIFTARYDVLLTLYLDYQNVKSTYGEETEFLELEGKLKKLFHYSGEKGSPFPEFQLGLADFFMSHAEDMDLHVCHYCEMAYINSYSEPSVMDDFAHFLKHGNPSDLSKEIRSDNGNFLSQSTLDAILKLRNSYEEDKIVEAFDQLKCWKNPKVKKSVKLKMKKMRNHFDLDHFLPKSKCPLVGLSLYNFVPSCQVCNEKLKKQEELGGGNQGKMLRLSPTSDQYEFENEMTMRIMPVPLNLRVQDDADKYRLAFTPSSSDYQEEVRVFHLTDRYNYHKYEAFRLYDKLTDYPPARIKMLRNDFNGMKTEKEIEEDLFGMGFLKSHHRCFNKLMVDVYNQHRSKL